MRMRLQIALNNAVGDNKREKYRLRSSGNESNGHKRHKIAAEEDKKK